MTSINKGDHRLIYYKHFFFINKNDKNKCKIMSVHFTLKKKSIIKRVKGIRTLIDQIIIKETRLTIQN